MHALNRPLLSSAWVVLLIPLARNLNAQNVAILEQIKEDLTDVSAMWVVDYRGLTVKQVQQLRREVRAAGAFMKVYKNTLVHRALADMNLANLDEILEGPSAFIFAGADPVASAKVLKDFAKNSKIMQIKSKQSLPFLRRSNSSVRSPALSRAWLAASLFPSAVFRAVLPWPLRLLPNRNRLPKGNRRFRNGTSNRRLSAA